jgi:putative tryptophan/tyrosine transport system substrate-binding protein
MKRRDFIALLGAAASLFPGIAPAQRSDGLPRVAVLEWESADTDRMAAFDRGLRDLGYVEGRNIRVEYHFANGRGDRADALAAEIVRQSVSVIVAFATPAAIAAKKATATIPIVISSADPIGTGLVSNLARPGGNITGVSNMMPDLESKRLEILRELLPGLKRAAFLGSSQDPAAPRFVAAMQAAAARIDVQVVPVLIAGADEIEGALARMVADKIQAVIVQPLFALNTKSAARVAELAAQYGIPTITTFAHFARSGGLMSYGPQAEFSRYTAARYVDQILKGANPGDLPVEQPTIFEFVMNRKTAALLGLDVPTSILLRADEIIE